MKLMRNLWYGISTFLKAALPLLLNFNLVYQDGFSEAILTVTRIVTSSSIAVTKLVQAYLEAERKYMKILNTMIYHKACGHKTVFKNISQIKMFRKEMMRTS